MKQILVVFIAVSLLNACASIQVIPTENQVRSIQRIRIIALAAPPLEVTSPLVLHKINLSQLPMVSATPTSVFLVKSGIFMKAEVTPNASNAVMMDSQDSGSLAVLLSHNDLWKPTDILSEEIAQQLSENGWQTARSPVLQDLPGIDDLSYAYIWEFLHQWYDSDVSPFNYSEHLVGSNETIVELGIIEYSVFPEGRLLLQVGVKIVDPVTKKILGKASESYHAPIDNEKAFQGDGTIFKEVVSKTGKELVRRCLSDLLLIPHP